MYLKKIAIVDFSMFDHGNNTLTKVVFVEHIAINVALEPVKPFELC